MSTTAPANVAGGAGAAASTKDDEIPLPKSDDFFESKTFRLFTVFLYVGGVSGLGMALAMYYMFIWDSRMPPLPEFKHTHHIG